MDKKTLKAWFTRGKKPTAAQFAAWMDSYWHKDEPLPATAIDGLLQMLDAKAFIDDSAPSTATTYSSEKIRQMVAELVGSLQPEKDVVPVATVDELQQIEEPDSEVLYLVAESNEVYAWNGMTYVLVNTDNALRIRELSELDGITDAGEYKVVWIERLGKTRPGTASFPRYKCASWSLSVGTNAEAVTQHLANRDGYYARNGRQFADGVTRWGEWERRLYALLDDNAASAQTAYSSERVEKLHRHIEKKQRTSVHYCSSRMKYAMPKVGTTVLIDDNREHFWGFASFGRPKNGGHGMKGATADDLENVRELAATGETLNGLSRTRYSVRSGTLAVPEWVSDLWQAEQADRFAYLRVKPFASAFPEIEVMSDDGNLMHAFELANASGSTGLTGKGYLPALPDGVTIALEQVANPVCDLCVKARLNGIGAATARDKDNTNVREDKYSVGDIVRFDGKRWVRIDRLDTGRSVRVLYQGIRVERTGGATFRYDNRLLRLPDFKKFEFRYESADTTSAIGTLASPLDVLDGYLKYACSEKSDGTFVETGSGVRHLARCTLAVMAKHNNGHGGTAWHMALPNPQIPTGTAKGARSGNRRLLTPLTKESGKENYPWYADAYIVAMRKVKNVNQEKKPKLKTLRPYDRNVEVSNRIPVRVSYIRRNDGTTTVRVRPYARA